LNIIFISHRTVIFCYVIPKDSPLEWYGSCLPFYGGDEFHRILEMTIWHSLIIFQAVFSLYDKDNSGCLSAFELRQALNSAGYRLNNHILNILALRYSTKNGLITFDDFMMCAVRLKAMIGELSHSALLKG